MILTINIAQTELDKIEGLEDNLRELSNGVMETELFKGFMPQSGQLIRFINLLGKWGVVYEVASQSGLQGDKHQD